jgi:hypothetical protein
METSSDRRNAGEPEQKQSAISNTQESRRQLADHRENVLW